MWIQIAIASLEDSVAVTYKAKYTLKIQSAIMFLISNICPTDLKLCPHKNIYMNAYNSFIQNHSNKKATKYLSISELINILCLIIY